MKLEKTIQRSQKSFGGIIGQTRQVAYVTEWELIYHEVLAISNSFEELTNSSSSSSDAVILNRELNNTKISEYNETVTKVVSFISSRGNPYTTSASSRLYHFTTGQLVSPECTEQWLSFFVDAFNGYIDFRESRYITKKKTLGDSIKRVKFPPFVPKSQGEILDG